MGNKHFGEHLIIDGYEGSEKLLNDQKVVLDCLNKLPELLQMNKLSDAVTFFAPGNNSKDPGGWSGFVVIAESHISIHTFPARGFISADVYTCKNGMDLDFILQYFRESFKLKNIEHHLIIRGSEYPIKNIY